MEQSEKLFQRQVIDLLHTFGYRVAHFMPAMNHKGQWRTPVAADGKGFPDLVAIRPKGRHSERVIFAELKTDKGRLSADQSAWLVDLERSGAECYLWRPRDWQSIVEILR
jgi:VRR-NUC domain